MSSALGKRRRTPRTAKNKSPHVSMNSSNHTLRNAARKLNRNVIESGNIANSVKQSVLHANASFSLKNLQNFGESNENYESRTQIKKQKKLLLFFLQQIINPDNHNKVQMIETLIHKHGFDPSFNDNAAIKFVSEKGVADVAAVLLSDPRVDPTVNGNNPIELAITHNHPDVVRVLLADPLQRVVPEDNDMLEFAIKKNVPDVVRVLLADPRVDPSFDTNNAFRLACQLGFLEIVNILLQDPRVDPSIYPFNYMYSPIYLAATNGHVDVVDRLLQDPRINAHPHILQILSSTFEAATSKGHFVVAERLLEDPRINILGFNKFENTLINACKYGDVEKVDFLLRTLLKPEHAHKISKKEIVQLINTIAKKIKKKQPPPHYFNPTFTSDNYIKILVLLKEFRDSSYMFAPVKGGRQRTQKKR
jgi:ankyrin repeat protein